MADTISDAGLVKTLRNRFGIRGDTDFGLESSIIPVFDTTDAEPPYHARSGGAIVLSQAAVVGQISYMGIVALSNLPANFRAVIKGMLNLSATNLLMQIFDTNSATWNAIAPVASPVSIGWNGLERPAAQSFIGASATNANASAFQLLGSAAGQLLPLKWVIAPGQALLLQGSVNQLVQASFYWDEYYVA